MTDPLRDDATGRAERAPEALAHALGERIKELHCLYGIARLAARNPDSVDDLLKGALRLFPPAWQYPEATVAAIVFHERRYESPGYVDPPWRQTANLLVDGVRAGEVIVGYIDPQPDAYEGPFLREERALIDAAAEYLGVITGRILAGRHLAEMNRLLTVEREALREANAALRAILARIEDEKRELGRDIRANVEKILLPIIEALALDLTPSRRPYAELLRRNLLDITAPFARYLDARPEPLTPAELGVCAMIKDGLRTKDIARLRGIAPATVNRHRESIRRKLGLTGRTVNLAGRLQQLGGALPLPGNGAETPRPEFRHDSP